MAIVPRRARRLGLVIPDEMEKRLEMTFKPRLVSVVIAVVAGAAIVLIGALYTQTRQVSAAVIAPQKDIISARAVMGTSTKEFQESTQEIRRSSEEAVKSAKAELAAATKQLEDANAKLRAAVERLGEAAAEYDGLMRKAQERVGKPRG